MKKKNKIKKIIVVFGTRPEAIKMAPIVKELQKYPKNFKVVICVTAQHREMLDDVLGLFNIKANYDLNIMKGNQSLFEITAKGLIGIKGVLSKEKPDIMLVQGDTTTTFVASLAAFYLKIPVGHIEAGLRTKDKYRPFPEEINRRLTSHVADFNFAPTKRAVNHLLSEGVSKKHIYLTGNTAIDSLFYIVRKIRKDRDAKKKISFLDYEGKKIIVVTAHRRENFGKPIRSICKALKKIAQRNKDVVVVYPVHPNPNIKKPVFDSLKNIKNITLSLPLDYLSFTYLMSKAYLILTDSGGIQEESFSLGKPTLIMREKTERLEAVEGRIAKLIGTDVNRILRETEKLLKNKKAYHKIAKPVNIFGDGKAAQRIVKVLLDKV